MSFEKPYDGIRVVDLSQGVAGPYCAMLLARHGADVVKVEPLDGDWARLLAPIYGDHTAFSVASNVGKRSISLDLKTTEGKEIVDRLVQDADVFMEGFRPGVIERLGFSYDRLSKINKKLIYVSVSGFGQTGPLREKPAMDPVLQAFTGFMMENKGPDGVPHRTPTIINDMTTALYAHQAVVAALFAARDEKRGRFIDVSLMAAAANLQTVRMMSGYRDGPFKPGTAPSGTFATDDGWLQIVVIRDRDFQTLCKALGLDEMATDPRYETSADRYQHAEFLNKTVGDIFKSKPAAHWRDVLTEAGLQNEVVQSYEQFIHHPHTQETGFISWMVHAGSDEPWPAPNVPGLPRLDTNNPNDKSPTNGQHSREVLAGLGYSEADIERFASGNIIRV